MALKIAAKAENSHFFVQNIRVPVITSQKYNHFVQVFHEIQIISDYICAYLQTFVLRLLT